jgi:hypothetical protein
MDAIQSVKVNQGRDPTCACRQIMTVSRASLPKPAFRIHARKPATRSSRQLRPRLLQPLDTHRLRGAQLLGEEAHAQFFQQPAKLLQALVHHAFALGHQAPVALLQRAQLGQARRISGRVGAVFVQARGDGFEVAGKVLQRPPR